MDNRATLPHAADTEWVRLAGSGDPAAFDQLVQHYRPVLLALTFLRTRNLCDAEDLVQQVLLRVWQKLPGLHQPALFLPWIKTIAANACSTWSRRGPSPTSSLDTEPACQLLAEGGPKPLESLLSGET